MSGDIHDYYIRRARWIAERENQPGTLPDAEAWREQRPELHRQFMASLGLDQMPEPCDLRATEMGTFSGPGYTARKLAYQLLPDCWGSAHLYRPADLPDDQLTPAVLYTCGHSAAGVIGYQHHAIGWARRGYTCLVFDTIQQHDNPGEHQAMSHGKTPEWIALGYSAAGGELYNGLRALDLLLAQPGVDPDRVGVTGNSGGGSQSFFLAAADERVRAVATLCGVSDPAHAIKNRTAHQHCDCIYLRNRYAHDLSRYAALIAPRALLYCFARHDALFTPPEFRDLFRRSRARFEQLGYGEHCALCEYDGPHGYNHTETVDTIHRWFDRHVAGETHPDVDTLAIATNGERLDETTLSVFHGRPPQPNHLDLLPQLLTPRGQVDLPRRPEQWQQIKDDAVARLRDEVFHLLDDVQQPQQLVQFGQWAGCRDAWHGQLDGMPQELLQLSPPDGEHEGVVIAMGERGMPVLPVVGDMSPDLRAYSLSGLGIEPRAAGAMAFREEHRHRLTREGLMVGMTPTMMMVQDLHHLWPLITKLPRVRDRPLYLYGKGEGAVAMLFHALLHPDPAVAGIILEDLPGSQTETDYQIMSLLRVMDLPQAVGLLAPTPVALIHGDGKVRSRYFAERVFQRLGGSGPFQVFSMASALEQVVTRAAEAVT